MLVCPCVQGGFARCFAFTNMDKNKLVAGKVVDKMSLNKNKAKQKVRVRAELADGGARRASTR